MLPIGHIGVSILIGRIFNLKLIYVAIGALLPDIIDKTMRIANAAPASRYIGHSLLAGVTFFILVFALTRNKDSALSTTFGAYIHLIEDLPYFLPLLFPLVDYTWPVSTSFNAFNPINFVFEVIGLASIFVTLNDKYWKSGPLFTAQKFINTKLYRQVQ